MNIKKIIIRFVLFIVLLLCIGCKRNKNVRILDPPLKGDFYEQCLKGNIKDGIQWKWDTQNKFIRLDDSIENFYDFESTTEVGDFMYFFRGDKVGDDVITWTLYDTKDGKVYCTLKHYITISEDISDNGFKILTLNKYEIVDNRTESLKEYTYDEPMIMYHVEGNGG